MQFSCFKNIKVLVFGLGILGGGVGVAKFLTQNGAKVTVTDLKTKRELSSSLKKLSPYSIKYVLGRHREEDFKNCDMVVKNPAVPADSDYLKIAQKHKIPIEIESSLFFKLCPSQKIIGITGTKGKTTTTLLVGEILKKLKKDVVVGGNLTISMLELLDKIKRETFVVLELSSWHLEGLEPFNISPHYALITNILPDHLNRYSSMADYVKAKKMIFKFQTQEDSLILNWDNPTTRKFESESKGEVFFFSKKQDRVWQTRSSENQLKIDSDFWTKIKLLGEHNQENILAALCLSLVLRLDKKGILRIVQNFSGVHHRLESIGQIDGINFIDDTTATTPDATIAALNSVPYTPILICGGADKKLDFSKMTSIVNKKAKAVVLLEGPATKRIEKSLEKQKILGRFDDFEKAVRKAFFVAKRGDIVLLSPACASFGMFKNEFDRGEQFRKIFKNLKKENAQP